MKLIEVPIWCNTDASSELANLGIKTTDQSELFEIRKGKIDIEKICGYYPSCEDNEVIVHINGDTFSVMMSYEDFNKLINQHV